MAAVAAPKGLGTVGRKLWKDTTSQFDLRVDELQVLRAACTEVDLIAGLEEAFEGQPYTTLGSTGQLVVHPIIPELRQHRAALAGLLGKLKLPDPVTGERPNQQREAVQSRWSKFHGSVEASG